MTATAFKDKLSDPAAGVSDSVPADYRRVLLDSRRKQLATTQENLVRLERTFRAAAENVITSVDGLRFPQVTAAERLQLLSDIDATLRTLRREFGDLLEAGMVEVAQTAADREARTAALLGAPSDNRLPADLTRTVTFGGEEATVQFGRLSLGAVERVATRYYSDGLHLSDRLHNLDARTRKTVEDTIVQGITEQVNAQELGDRLRAALLASGRETSDYHAVRIARTEMTNAHREAALMSMTTPDGRLKPYLSGILWRLSLSHPAADICDIYAGYDAGFGDGVFMPADVPSGPHPHCLCSLVGVLIDYPDVGGPGLAPNVAAVPPSQIAYYADRGDPVAAATATGAQAAK